ncbi:MAG: 5'/3'-nucleotidase SurE [Firmicutes bacterium]|nr:5'/3'-nucleotidase SurE [Bacillota bacterium]
MIILLTNDDGVRAPGLHALRSEMEAMRGAEVFVVAPDEERSCSGHGITIRRPLRVEEVHCPGSPSKIWAVSGTPADCTKIGVTKLLPKPPDLVVSGINRGPNLGADVLYSGTVAAAMEAVVLGIPAMAVSLDGYDDLDYGYTARFAAYLAEVIVARGACRSTLLNVNVPAVPPDLITGVAITRLGERRYNDEFERREDSDGGAYYFPTGGLLDAAVADGTDVAAVRDNKISITPIHLDLTAHWAVQEMCAWNIGLPGARRR